MTRAMDAPLVDRNLGPAVERQVAFDIVRRALPVAPVILLLLIGGLGFWIWRRRRRPKPTPTRHSASKRSGRSEPKVPVSTSS